MKCPGMSQSVPVVSCIAMWNPFSRPLRRLANDRSPGSSGVERASVMRAMSSVGLAGTAPKDATSESAAESRATPAAVNASQIAEVDRIGSITVVTLIPGELTEHRGGAELADLLDDLVSRGDRQLVLDIQNVMFMDSRCVGCLVQAMNELARQGGRETGIVLANPRASVAHLFRLTRLDRVFPICNDVLAAVNVLERRMKG